MDALDRVDVKKYPRPILYDVVVKWPDANPKIQKNYMKLKKIHLLIKYLILKMLSKFQESENII